MKKVEFSVEELYELSISLNDSIQGCRRYQTLIREDRTISELQRRQNLTQSLKKESRLKKLMAKINQEVERRLDK